MKYAVGLAAPSGGARPRELYFDAMWQMTTDYPSMRQSKHVYVGETRVATRCNIEGERDVGYEELNTYYYHGDHLGSAQMVTSSSGEVYEHTEYTPYGELWIEATSETTSKTPFRFTGKELDEETGLYYYGARYMDPKTSRWISGDPALESYLPVAPVDDNARKRNASLPGMGGVFNLVNLAVYDYAGNNPLKYIDPTGLIPVDAAIAKAVEQNVQSLVRAQDRARATAIYRPGAGGPFNRPDPGNTWCNLSTFDVAEATGVSLSTVIGTNPRFDTTANMAATQLRTGTQSPAGVPAPGRRVELTGQQAQSMANEGWTVIAAYYNPEGHGHLATVRPSDSPYDSTRGPLVSNVGADVGVESSSQAFGQAYTAGQVHYYYDPHQDLPSARRESE